MEKPFFLITPTIEQNLKLLYSGKSNILYVSN